MPQDQLFQFGTLAVHCHFQQFCIGEPLSATSAKGLNMTPVLAQMALVLSEPQRRQDRWTGGIAGVTESAGLEGLSRDQPEHTLRLCERHTRPGRDRGHLAE